MTVHFEVPFNALAHPGAFRQGGLTGLHHKSKRHAGPHGPPQETQAPSPPTQQDDQEKRKAGPLPLPQPGCQCLDIDLHQLQGPWVQVLHT